VTVVNCRFANNKNVLLLYQFGYLFVIGSQFTDNRADQRGAAIRMNEATTASFSSTLFARNVAATFDGGAISAGQGSVTTINNCSFYDNHAYERGGAMVTDSATFHDVSFLQGSVTIRNSVFRNNTAARHGGAIMHGEKFMLKISNTGFADNVALSGDGGAVSIAPGCAVSITASEFERNRAPSGSGGALTVSASKIDVIDSNFTDNTAGADGGAVRSTGGAVFYPRGETHFDRNVAQRSGGAISLDASSLKTNEAALVFTENSARLGGALAAENEAHVLMQSGCQTTTVEMHWASSQDLLYAEDSHSVLLRSVGETTTETLFSTVDMIDERGEWTMLYPPGAEDANVSFCLSPGEYEVIASQGGYCVEGFGGGFLRIVDLADSELLAPLTLLGLTDTGTGSRAGSPCVARANVTIVGDSATTAHHRGSLLFDRNKATGTSDGFCGTGCGGALFIGDSCSADLGQMDFAHNSAADGGALFVDLLAELSLSHSTMRNNTATKNGGAISAGNLAAVTVRQSTARNNAAGQSGGVLHLSGVSAAALDGIDATGNTAGTTGGAVAVVDSARNTITLTNSTIRRNAASGSGGGVSLEDSVVDIAGVEFHANSVKRGSGGAVATSGANARVEFPATECTNVDVLVDWTTAGNKQCEGDSTPVLGFVCDAWALYFETTCADVPGLVAGAFGASISCEGCACNVGYGCHIKFTNITHQISNMIPLSPFHRENNLYEKYFTIEKATNFSQVSNSGMVSNSSMDYDEASVDFEGVRMRGLPFAGMMRKFSFCAVPGEYTLHAIDAGADAWWGGAAYAVVVNGVTVVREEMRHSSKQSNTFSVILPASSHTRFDKNSASRGGGGAVFWENAPPGHIESYRQDSDSNSAMYGDFIASPSRALSTAHSMYNASPGLSMTTDPIIVDLLDA
jgi:predicted outer membrane repeat protein